MSPTSPGPDHIANLVKLFFETLHYVMYSLMYSLIHLSKIYVCLEIQVRLLSIKLKTIFKGAFFRATTSAYFCKE